MKLLYVDDKETWHKLLEIVLSLRGVEVLHAHTPKEALNIASLEKPDLALVDVSISGGTGYDIIQNLQNLGIPVVFIGHKSEGFESDKALSLGAYATLRKPFTVEELLDLLRQVKKKITKPEEHLELTPSESGEFEAEIVEPSVPEIHVEEFEETVPVIPLEIEEEVSSKVEKPVEGESLPYEEIATEAGKEVSRRVEELSGVTVPEEKIEEIVREVAWEVVPEIAERVIREEIEKLIRSRLA